MAAVDRLAAVDRPRLVEGADADRQTAAAARDAGLPPARLAAPNAAPGLWSTAAFGLNAAPSALELNLLGDHLLSCRHGVQATALHCGAHALRGFIAAHLVTCAALCVLAVVVLWQTV
jgi:hypothetical protein